MDDYNHYMSKAEIARGIVDGTAGRTLCGDLFTPVAHGDGEVMDADLSVCPMCQVVYDQVSRKKHATKSKDRTVSA